MSDPVFDEAKRALERLSADPAAQRLLGAPEAELSRWARRILPANTLDQVFESSD